MKRFELPLEYHVMNRLKHGVNDLILGACLILHFENVKGLDWAKTATESELQLYREMVEHLKKSEHPGAREAGDTLEMILNMK